MREKINLREGYYYKKIQENIPLILLCLILAAFCTMITYPGIWYVDSYTRVGFSLQIVENIRLLFSGQRSEFAQPIWLTPVPSFVVAICKLITGNFAAYTLLQAFAFFLMTFLLVRKLGTSYRRLQHVLFVINPLIYCVSVYFEASIGCVTGIAGLILILTSLDVPKNKLDSIIEFILLVSFSFITFGYRANAFTILPVLLFYIIKCKNISKIIVTGAIVMGFLFVFLVPKVLNIRTMSSGVAGFVWEMVTVIQDMEPEKQKEYVKYLDEIGGEGATAEAIEISDNTTINGLLMAKGLEADHISAEGASTIILQKYVHLAIQEPQSFWKMKWDFTLRTLGINQPLSRVEYEYNRRDKMGEYEFSDSAQRELFVNTYQKTTAYLSFIVCRPWVVFLLSGVLVFLEWKRKGPKRTRYLFVLLISLFYYSAFIITTQSFEIRYFYPSLYLCMIMDVAILADILHRINEKIRLKRNVKKADIST